MSSKTNLSAYSNSWYQPGAGFLTRVAWYLINAAFFASYFPFNGVKLFLLRLFGAAIGRGVVVKPAVSIKYPWKLRIGDHSWIGEKVWIDNLAPVTIGSNCCVSQGALLLTGNHDYSKTTFDLIVKDIVLEDGAWVGAKAVVCPGVTIHSHAVLSAGSVATQNLDAYSIYQGNPALKVRERSIS